MSTLIDVNQNGTAAALLEKQTLDQAATLLRDDISLLIGVLVTRLSEELDGAVRVSLNGWDLVIEWYRSGATSRLALSCHGLLTDNRFTLDDVKAIAQHMRDTAREDYASRQGHQDDQEPQHVPCEMTQEEWSICQEPNAMLSCLVQQGCLEDLSRFDSLCLFRARAQARDKRVRALLKDAAGPVDADDLMQRQDELAGHLSREVDQLEASDRRDEVARDMHLTEFASVYDGQGVEETTKSISQIMLAIADDADAERELQCDTLRVLYTYPYR